MAELQLKPTASNTNIGGGPMKANSTVLSRSS